MNSFRKYADATEQACTEFQCLVRAFDDDRQLAAHIRLPSEMVHGSPNPRRAVELMGVAPCGAALAEEVDDHRMFR